MTLARRAESVRQVPGTCDGTGLSDPWNAFLRRHARSTAATVFPTSKALARSAVFPVAAPGGDPPRHPIRRTFTNLELDVPELHGEIRGR